MELKAFISYRRSDAFMHPEDGGADVDFSETIADGLRDAGFTVFRDVDDIIEGDHYEYRLREGLANADLFVAVIGERWQSAVLKRILFSGRFGPRCARKRRCSRY